MFAAYMTFGVLAFAVGAISGGLLAVAYVTGRV